MKTIKVIDLLNKIANGEELPKKIKYEGREYIENNRVYENCKSVLLLTHISYIYQLNDEVEILEELEEKKIPEKIEKDDFEGINEEEPKLWIAIRKINEIIDYLERKEKGE